MILTITPNAGIDRTLVVPGFSEGGVFRPEQAVVVAGGKGVNVARAARILGGTACCCGFIAGHIGALYTSLALREGLAARWTALPDGETRICTILVDLAREQTTVVNEAGVATTAADWEHLRADILSLVHDADAIALCGSLPPGTSLGRLTSLLAELRDMGKSVWVDSSGVGLQTAAALTGIHLKINKDEAESLLGLSLPDHSVGDAALSLAQRRAAVAVITLGRQGAVLSDGNKVWSVQPPDVKVKNAVGSGDSFLAGLLVSLTQGAALPEALRWASAAGTANTLSVGGGEFTKNDFERILSDTQIIR